MNIKNLKKSSLNVIFFLTAVLSLFTPVQACTDTTWQSIDTTTIDIDINSSYTFTPTVLSSPTGCKTASIQYTDFTANGQAQECPSFFTYDSETNSYTIAPVNSDSVLNSPYTFTVTQSDPDDQIASQTTGPITINIQIKEAQCTFSALSEQNAYFPRDSQNLYISKQLSSSTYSELCGSVSHEYSTSYTDASGNTETITSETNGGFPSFMTLTESLELNPDESSRSYSTYHTGGAGNEWNASTLDSDFAWIADVTSGDFSDLTNYMIIDAGEQVQIQGLILQGRDDSVVTQLKLAYSDDEDSWQEYQNGYSQPTGMVVQEQPTSRSTLTFSSTITARYFKITPLDWQTFPAIRAGLLLAEQLTVTPTLISQAATYAVEVTRTLTYDARVIRDSDSRVETSTFNIVVSADCAVLTLGEITQTCLSLYLTTDGLNCSTEDMITDENTCEQAAAIYGATYESPVSKTDRIAGCFKNNINVIKLNTNVEGTGPGDHHSGICINSSATCSTATTQSPVGSTTVISLIQAFQYNYATGLQSTDEGGTEWSTVCSSITFTGQDSAFMTDDTADSGAQTLQIVPTLLGQVGSHEITATLSTNGHTNTPTTYMIDVTCPDDAWQAQQVTETDVYIDQTSTFTPILLSSPNGCKIPNITYTLQPEWTTELNGTLTLSPVGTTDSTATVTYELSDASTSSASSYYMAEAGTYCEGVNFIDTQEECQQAHDAIGGSLQWYNFSGQAGDPPGCFFDTNFFKFNENLESTDTHISYGGVCKSTESSSSSTNIDTANLNLDLTIKITTDTCDAATLPETQDQTFNLFDSNQITLSKLWAEEPYQTLCGTISHTFQTYFTPYGESDSQLLSTETGLPSFVTLDTDTENEDHLLFDPQNIADLGTYNIQIQKTKNFNAAVETSESEDFAVITEIRYIKILPNCSALEYKSIETFPTEVFLAETIQFKPERTFEKNNGDAGLSIEDSNGTSFSEMCDLFIDYELTDLTAQFATYNNASGVFETCSQSIYAYADVLTSCTDQLTIIGTEIECETAASISNLTYGLLDGSYENKRPAGCFQHASGSIKFNPNLEPNSLQGDHQGYCYDQTCQSLLNEEQKIIFNPTEKEHLGLHTVQVTQKAPSHETSLEQEFPFEVKLNVDSIFALDETSSLEFQLGDNGAIVIQFSISCPLEFDISLEFQIEGEDVSDWVIADLENQTISILPENDEITGSQLIDLICTVVFTEAEYLQYLVSENLNGNTLVFETQFSLNILQALAIEALDIAGPDFEDTIENQTKQLGEIWSLQLPATSDPLDSDVVVSWSVSPDLGFIEETLDGVSLTELTIYSQESREQSGDYTFTLTLTADDERQTNVSFLLSIQDEEDDGNSYSDIFNEEILSEYLLSIDESETEVEVSEQEVDPSQLAPKVEQKMSNTGELKLQFDQLMKFGTTLPTRNDINIIMKTPFGDFNGRYYVYEGEKPIQRRLQAEDVKFSWTVKEMTENSIDLDIQFNAPLEISNQVEPDNFEIQFLSDIFVSLESEQPLDLGDSRLNAIDFQIPRQFVSKEEQERVQNLAESASAVVNLNIVLVIIGQIFAKQLIKKIVPLFLTLQIVFYVVINYPFPLNVTYILEALDDAIKLGALKRVIFEQIEGSDNFESFKTLADETGMLVLMGVPLVTVLTILAVIISVCCKKSVKCRRLGKKLKDKLVFSLVIQVCMISSLTFSIQAGFGRAFSFQEERANSNSVMTFMVILLLGFSFFFARFVDTSYMEKGGQFAITYGILYKKYRYWNDKAALYLFFFFIHRIAIVFIFNLQAVFSLTYMCLMFICISWISYLILYDPYLEKQETNKEIMNSYLFVCISYFVPAYTLMTPDPAVRYEFGNFTIVIVGIMVAANLIWTIIQLIQDRCKKKVLEQIRKDRLKAHELQTLEDKYILTNSPRPDCQLEVKSPTLNQKNNLEVILEGTDSEESKDEEIGHSFFTHAKGKTIDLKQHQDQTLSPFEILEKQPFQLPIETNSEIIESEMVRMKDNLDQTNFNSVLITKENKVYVEALKDSDIWSYATEEFSIEDPVIEALEDSEKWSYASEECSNSQKSQAKNLVVETLEDSQKWSYESEECTDSEDSNSNKKQNGQTSNQNLKFFDTDSSQTPPQQSLSVKKTNFNKSSYSSKLLQSDAMTVDNLSNQEKVQLNQIKRPETPKKQQEHDQRTTKVQDARKIAALRIAEKKKEAPKVIYGEYLASIKPNQKVLTEQEKSEINLDLAKVATGLAQMVAKRTRKPLRKPCEVANYGVKTLIKINNYNLSKLKIEHATKLLNKLTTDKQVDIQRLLQSFDSYDGNEISVQELILKLRTIDGNLYEEIKDKTQGKLIQNEISTQ